MRTSDLKRDREGRDAALFTFGMGLASGKRIAFARHEGEDYDFVTAWVEDGTANYTPVQLKELVPAELNPTATLEALLGSLARRYSQPTSTVLAVYLNRAARLQDLLAVRLPELGFAEVWYFCAVSPDAQRYAIFGDAKTELKELLFDYPS
ncbi:MAG: hypothetical protein L0177_15710 [Chloroflexi bacterium]|nr:hypothetical protein [Chloroflexota bacterium]